MSARPAVDLGGPVRFDLRTFTQSAGLLSLGPLANVLRAIVTAKLFALTLGPSMVGVLVQLLNFSALISATVQFGLTSGVVKMVAEARGDERMTSRVAGTAGALSVATALAASVLLLPFAGQVSAVLTGSSRYGALVVILIFSFPIYNLAGAAAYVLQGLSAVRRLTRASVANAGGTLLVLVPATIAFGITGAMASVLAGSVIQLALYTIELWLAYRERAWHLATVRFARREARALLGFATVLLAGSIANWAALLVVRTILVRTLGQHDNGLYQAVYGFSSQYITVFNTWMAAYVFPRVVARGAGDLDELLNSALRANLFLMTPVLCTIVALRDPVIQVFYSGAFLPAAPMMLVQALGDYARIVGWSMGVALFALGRVRAHLLLVAGEDVLWVLLAVALIPRFGLGAVSAAYALSYLMWPVLAYPMLRAWFGFRLTIVSVGLVAAGLAAMLAAGLLPQPLGAAAIPVVPLLVLLQRRAGAARARSRTG